MGAEILKFAINLMYKFYSGDWLENKQPDFNCIDGQAKNLCSELCEKDIFSQEFIFTENWITSIFSDISFRPVVPAKTYFQAGKIEEEKIIFPGTNQGNNQKNNEIANEIKNAYFNFQTNPDALLTLLQKYGSFIPITKNSPISLYELTKFLEAVRQCNGSYLLVSADFSGIQNFIYTISSKGALKSLRARSFFISLLSEHIIYEILKKHDLNRSAIIFSGGGSFCLLLPSGAEQTLKDIKKKMNSYLLNELAGKLYLALVYEKYENLDKLIPSNFHTNWSNIGKLLEEDKFKKFQDNLSELLAEKSPSQLTNQDECQICHRDDLNEMKQITDSEGNQMSACPLCKELFFLGDALTDYKYICRWEERPGGNGHLLEIPSLNGNAYYWVSKRSEGTFHWIKNSFEPTDSWPFFSADYVTLDRENKTADFEYLADKSQGKKLIGCLRMDVDNLGIIFSKGIKEELFSPITLSLLSNSFNLFFTIYMNLICKKKIDNRLLIPAQARDGERPVSIIYSGGDDLLIVGAWNEICELSLDIRRNFVKYVGNNQDVSISGGIFLAHLKFPLYQMVNFSGKAEEIAKKNYGDCIKGDCCPNYQNCYFYEAGAIPKCKRKDSGLLFYTPSREEKKRKLHRIETALKWDEIECKVIEPLQTMYPIFAQPEEQAFSRALIFRFFSLVNKWENDGVLYLPLMHWVIERLKKLSNSTIESQIQTLSLIVFNLRYISSLHIPLTWLDLLKRERRQ